MLRRKYSLIRFLFLKHKRALNAAKNQERLKDEAEDEDVLGRNPGNFEAQLLKAYLADKEDEEDEAEDDLDEDEEDEGKDDEYEINIGPGEKLSSLNPGKISVDFGGDRHILSVPRFIPGIDGVSSVADIVERDERNKATIEVMAANVEDEAGDNLNSAISAKLANIAKRSKLEGLVDDRDVPTKSVKIKGKDGPLFLRLKALQRGDPEDWAEKRVSASGVF